MSDRFASILDRPATEIERPKPLPVGTYLTVIKGMPRYDKSAKKQTPFIEFTHAIQSAREDVSEEDLKAYLTNGAGEVKSLTAVTIKNTYYLTEEAGWRLKKFLGDLGFDMEDPENTMRVVAEQSAGSEVYVTIRHRPSEDGRNVFAEIADTAAVE